VLGRYAPGTRRASGPVPVIADVGQKYMLPHFKPRDVRKCDGTVELIGVPSTESYKGQTWLGAKWIGYLGRVAEAPVSGRWFPEGDEWKFVSEDKAAFSFVKEEDLLLYDGYWGGRVYMVLAGLIWGKEEYIPNKPGDHKHCEICWATISLPDDAICYRSNKRDIVCPECYQRFVIPHSIDFIT